LAVVRTRFYATALAVALAACGGGGAPSPGTGAEGAAATADVPRGATVDPGPVLTASEYRAEPRFANANLERGELLALACAACHHFRGELGTLIGPNLHGVFGRPAAALPGFEYSAALRASGIVWTPISLEAWLAEPAGFVAGTTMAFAGYRSPDDRRDLIAYLLKITE
jgi:cytochrome c